MQHVQAVCDRCKGVVGVPVVSPSPVDLTVADKAEPAASPNELATTPKHKVPPPRPATTPTMHAATTILTPKPAPAPEPPADTALTPEVVPAADAPSPVGQLATADVSPGRLL